ncbi:hypothetical protein [Flavobacterium sp.]|nr:hypothetical protein [Flavobacterium sp.]
MQADILFAEVKCPLTEDVQGKKIAAGQPDGGERNRQVNENAHAAGTPSN